MMSLIGKLFGTEKALTATVEAARDGIDALAYTDEEKATDAAKERAAARGMVVEWMQATQGQNLARRLLALMVTAVWLAMYVVGLLGEMIHPWLADPAFADKFAASAEALGERAYQMNGAVMLILGFYFAAPHMGAIVDKALGKFSRDKG